ncbi:MAG: T9SS type A sorting domain-containing protein [Bacteriovoracaceae bacterium]|nr:T9SS type A sorting domain-containing protein [Bacteroidota bacterium]
MNCRTSLAAIFLLIIGSVDGLYAWGSEGHRIVNLNGARSLPFAMVRFRDVEYYFADHASDVDRRKIREEEETYRQFIELERYPEFYNRTMPTLLLDLQKKYGEESVRQNGYLPYLILMIYDSLQRTIAARDWKGTLIAASDLGHYIGDVTMPLNTTMNYDGQLTKNNGIKWRYEIEMMNHYYNQVNFKRTEPKKFEALRNDPLRANPVAWVFSLLEKSHARVPSIMRADTAAYRSAKRNYNSTYYSVLWKEAGKFTNELMQEGADLYATLVYNSWLNAGGAKLVWPDEAKKRTGTKEPEHLEQNYPNPFNPFTTIKYTLKESFYVKLSVVNLFGQELDVLHDGRQSEGRYEYLFNGERLPGGVYFIRLQMNDITEARKMILAK